MDEETFSSPTDFSNENLRPSIETDYDDDVTTQKEADRSRAEDSEEEQQHYARDSSYVDHLEPTTEKVAPPKSTKPGKGDESSSPHDGADEDVFTDESPRSSLGSYDAGSESGKGVETDNMTTITHSSRISAISQYDKEDFTPTNRETPRPPLRTPSDVRATQMTSPPPSVVSSTRSSKKQFPSASSRIGTPSTSAQYSPKRMSTPPRFRSSRQDAPLVLLHVTLLPLRWVWGDLINNLDPADMSDSAKTLRASWRMLQDRVGDTVIERGVLLGHPQNDYEVLEERLLEALDLPVRRRAVILECGHYLGPSNESTIAEDDSDSDSDAQSDRRRPGPRRRWCATCKSEIRYEPPSDAKTFRVKVYASNGLMRAGAWEACWKEMERVDVELEPTVESTVQDEIVRLAAVQQEREIAQQEEAEIAKEVAMQYEQQRRSEQRRARAQSPSSGGSGHDRTREPSSVRRRRDEERLREIYGKTPPPQQSHGRESSPHRHDEPYSRPPTSHSAEHDSEEKDSEHKSESFLMLVVRSIRILASDRRNIIIATLSVFVLMLALRTAQAEPPYEPIIHVMKPTPQIRHADPIPIKEDRVSIEIRDRDSSGFQVSRYGQHDPSSDSFLGPYGLDEVVAASESLQPSWPRGLDDEACTTVERAQPMPQPTVTPSPNRRVYCHDSMASESDPHFFDDWEGVQETIHETVHGTAQEVETITEKKVVRVIHTVTETHTQTETQTEFETATAVETLLVKATEVPQNAGEEAAVESPVQTEEAVVETQTEERPAGDDSAMETPAPESESLPDCIVEPTSGESGEEKSIMPVESRADCIVRPTVEVTISDE
ncbi:hypothetical protein GGR50DRAFT_209881 [Xylaria sp. CBS 124048]|nr:hypothetical protein GGR50DRAFT_209881 [Xylaria sp. CBS 124048]